MSRVDKQLGRWVKAPGLMLRTRLFINLAPFMVILLAVGVYAIFLFPRLTADVYVSVKGNYASVRQAQQMKFALLRMEEGVSMALESNKMGGPVFEENRMLFEDNLNSQLANGKTEAENKLNRQLREQYLAVAKSGANIIASTNLEEQRTEFKSNLEKGLPEVDSVLDQIQQLNDHAIRTTTENVERITRDVTRSMAIGLIVAIIFAFYACYKLTRSILRPIQTLTRATRELGEGKLDHLLPVTSRDELGDLADSFNKMAARLKVYQESAAEKIVRLHRTLEATITSFPDPIFVLNRSGSIELTNLAAAELADALELKDELPEPLRETARKVLANGESVLPESFKEAVSYRMFGKEKFFLPRVLAMRNEENTLIGVAVVLYDVTRFRLLDDAKTNLVATVSHEIKTPLTSVRMALHLLLEKTLGVLTTRQNDLLIAARDESERLLRILNDLLDLTRLEEGNTDLYKEKTAPAELLQSAADIMREAVTNRKLRLTCKIDPNLPLVLVDRQRITHVFTNFIDNAIKYSPAGGEIILQASSTGDHEVQFSVIDQGPGVPEDHHERLFDRFYRVPGQPKKGAGLGLSIAREIVLAHGGRIGMKNAPEGGSDFYFVLPEAEEVSGAEAATATVASVA